MDFSKVRSGAVLEDEGRSRLEIYMRMMLLGGEVVHWLVALVEMKPSIWVHLVSIRKFPGRTAHVPLCYKTFISYITGICSCCEPNTWRRCKKTWSSPISATSRERIHSVDWWITRHIFSRGTITRTRLLVPYLHFLASRLVVGRFFPVTGLLSAPL